MLNITPIIISNPTGLYGAQCQRNHVNVITVMVILELVIEKDQLNIELPGDLLYEVLDQTDEIAGKMNQLLAIDKSRIGDWQQVLYDKDLVRNISGAPQEPLSVMAVDGGCTSERMTAADLLIAVVVGVQGADTGWSQQAGFEANKYLTWSDSLSHEEYNYRLLHGIMHLMELVALSASSSQIVLMDGSHITPISKINQLLGAKHEGAGSEYAQALRSFLSAKFNKIIPDIPDIFRRVFTDKRIVALTKYNSSKDFIDGVAGLSNQTNLDDKAFLSLTLKPDEYTVPQTFGQSQSERYQRWDNLRIHCNLDIAEASSLNQVFKEILSPVSTKHGKCSSLSYLYFKVADRLTYRLEVKQELAEDTPALEGVLYNLKLQTTFPFLTEPLPLFIADRMVKQVALTKRDIKQALLRSKSLKLDEDSLYLLNSYRG